MTYPSFEIIGKYATETPVLYWIQDPRRVDIYEARMNTVGRFGEGSWRYMRDVAAWVKKRIASEKIAFISQGNCLTEISREMFEIPSSMPVGDLVNPIEIDSQYKLDVPSKENRVVFLGRLEVVKRVWIVCELAKAMPQYEFYVVGASGRDQAANAKTLEPYRNFDGSSKISNLHFTGHLDGDAKNEQLKKAKLLINTSIWEAIPVTWLESLSYGTLLIAPFDRDELAGRFGSVVGDVLGDGTRSEDLAKFVRAIDYWMTHDEERIATAEKAIQFIRERHTVERFTRDMRAAILATML
jgi:glycosyltransferase involved in cell wall biosynthesis